MDCNSEGWFNRKTPSYKYSHLSRVSCQKGPICHASAWWVGPFWQDTLVIRLWRSTSHIIFIQEIPTQVIHLNFELIPWAKENEQAWFIALLHWMSSLNDIVIFPFRENQFMIFARRSLCIYICVCVSIDKVMVLQVDSAKYRMQNKSNFS